MRNKSFFSLILIALNKVVTAIGQANFTMAGFCEFVSKRFQIFDLSLSAPMTLFFLTGIPRALVTSLGQGAAIVVSVDKSREEVEHRKRVKSLGNQKMFFYRLACVPPFLSALLSGVGTYKFSWIVYEKFTFLSPAATSLGEVRASSLYLITAFSLFSSICAVYAYLAYNFDQAKKGTARILEGEWRNFGQLTWTLTVIHILGRAVFARYTIQEACKNSNDPFLMEVLQNISAVVALLTDFLSNIHCIDDLIKTLKVSARQTIFPLLPQELFRTEKILCLLTMILGLVDSLNYGCGTLLTGTKAIKDLFDIDGLYLCLFVFAPVSVFVNYAFNVKKGVEKYVVASLQFKDKETAS